MKHKPFSFTPKTKEDYELIIWSAKREDRSAASFIRHAVKLHINRYGYKVKMEQEGLEQGNT